MMMMLIIVVSQGKQMLNNVLVIKYKSLLYKSPETNCFLIQKCGLNFRNNGSERMWFGAQPQPSLCVSLQRGAWFLSLPTSDGPMVGLLTERGPGPCPGGRSDWLNWRRQKTSVWLHLYSGKRSAFTKNDLSVFSVDLCAGSGSRCGFDLGIHCFLTSAVRRELVFNVWS